MTAGASAGEQADLFGPLIESTERQVASLFLTLRALRRRERDYRSGAEGEVRAAGRVRQVLVDLGSTNWHLLADRRWPGTRQANIDLLLVGPPGVVVIDAKNWAEPRLAGGRLWRGQDDADDAIDKALAMADAVALGLAELGLAPPAVHPVLLFLGRQVTTAQLRGVIIVGEHALQRELTRLGPRLAERQVARVVAALDSACPPAAGTSVVGRRRRVPAPAEQQGPALFELDEIWAAVLEAAMREPIEAWMTWLHPTQAQLVTRSWSGPARIRGATGTGKTVVALHRVRHLARRPGARVLVTSFVKTLPEVHRALFARLAPELADRVEFIGLHAWALRLLRSRGQTPRIAAAGGRALFANAWEEVGRHGALASSRLPANYWWEEIQHVIKGRGLTDVEQYLRLVRIGRGTALREEQRRALWDIYEQYERALEESGRTDHCGVLLKALKAVRSSPVQPPYTAVVVDEVQDLTCVGVQLLHALTGDRPDGLLLVGDGQQSVYPGGFTLAEAGVMVTGRAVVLDRNYRNAGGILQAALEVVGEDMFDDMDADPQPGHRNISVERVGGLVLRALARDSGSQRAALLSALSAATLDGVRTGDMAVLVPTNAQATRWQRFLAGAGVPARLLSDYAGTESAEVKVGTYQRSKGLEFACVFLPDHDRAVQPPRKYETEESYGERAQLERRRLFVAMTRARDRLWLGSRRPTGYSC